MKTKRTEMPHAAHFICGDRCSFRRATHVNGFIVSTVGEMKNPLVFDRATGGMRPRNDGDSPDEIGVGRMYETMVFRAVKSPRKCCPFLARGCEIDFAPYGNANDANDGHEKMVAKYAKKVRR